MADGIRITEAGDQRVTQASDFRITEKLVVAEANLSGTGIFAAEPFCEFHGASAFTGTGTIAGLGTGTSRVSINLQATGSINAYVNTTSLVSADLQTEGTKLLSGSRVQFPHVDLQVTSTKVSQGERIQYGFATPSGSGSNTYNGGILQVAESNLTSNSTFAAGSIATFIAQFISEETEDIRFTEADDTRHTEAGDTRITRSIQGNIGDSNIIALGEVIPFSSIAYRYNEDDAEWQEFIPSVKYNGQWYTDSEIKIYKNINGSWKRSY